MPCGFFPVEFNKGNPFFKGTVGIESVSMTILLSKFMDKPVNVFVRQFVGGRVWV